MTSTDAPTAATPVETPVDIGEVLAPLEVHGAEVVEYFHLVREHLEGVALETVPAVLVAADAAWRAVWLRDAARRDAATGRALLAPWFERAAFHAPDTASTWTKAGVIASVRNSLLEQFHARSGDAGPCGTTLVRALTTDAAIPFAALWDAPVTEAVEANPVDLLTVLYPNAVAAFAALATLLDTGEASTSFTMVETDVAVPLSVAQGPDAQRARSFVARGSGTEPALDAVSWTTWARRSAGSLAVSPGWTQLGRSYNRLLRCVEWALTRDLSVLTVNALVTPGTVHRRVPLLELASGRAAVDQLDDRDGLDVTHRGAVDDLARALEEVRADPTDAVAARGVLPGRNERCWCDSGRKFKHCCQLPPPGPTFL